jgi:WD40 repeat protein
MLIHFFLIMLAAACLFSTSLRAQDLLQTISGHQTYIHDAAFSPDGHYVLSGDNQGYLRLWNRYGDPEIVLQAHAGPIYAVAFGASGQYLYSAGKDNQLKIWERNGQLQQKLATRAAVQEIYPDADGHVYLASTQVNDLFTRLLKPGHPRGLIHTEHVTFADKQGCTLSTDAEDKYLVLKDAAGKPLVKSGKHAGGILAVAAAEEGAYFLSGGKNRVIIRWNAEGKVLGHMQGHPAAITALSISPDGRYIASGDMQGNLLLWNNRGQLLSRTHAHAWCISSLAFSPDGQRLLTASWDGSLRIWSCAEKVAKSD